LNSMLSFADVGKKTAWTKFCDSLSTTAKLLQETKDALSTTAKCLQETGDANSNLEARLNAAKLDAVEVLELNDKLNRLNKEYAAKIKTLEADMAHMVSRKREDADRAAAKAKHNTSLAEGGGQDGHSRKEIDVMEVDLVADDPAVAQQKGVSPPPLPPVPAAGAQSAAAVPRKAGTIDVAQLRRRVASLTVENDRISKLYLSLVETDKLSFEPLKGRFNAEEFNKERKARLELATKLDVVGKETMQIVRKHSEIMEAQAVSCDKERAYWQEKVSELKKTVASLKEDVRKANATHGLVPCPSAFMTQGGVPMRCPVPIRSGFLMQLRDIYKQWIQFPTDNEGTFYCPFLCPFSGCDTMLAASEQVNIVLTIAASLRLDVSTAPLVFQYHHRGVWHNFCIIDQITITSMCCKLHRTKKTDGLESAYVCNSQFNLSIVVNKKIADLHMQAVHNSDQTHLVRLLDSTPNFFQLWTFISHPDQVDAGGEAGVPAAV
jgi:hypothetical protein